MKTLEDIFSSKEQRELLDKYEDACHQHCQAEYKMAYLKQALLDTLPIKQGVWFKYGKYIGLVKNVILYSSLDKMEIHYNPKGLASKYNINENWIDIDLPEDYDDIQIITDENKTTD